MGRFEVNLEETKSKLLSNFWMFTQYLDIKKNEKRLIPNHSLYRKVCKDISELNINTLILLPRRHLKTLIVSLFLIWYIMKYPNNAVTVICQTKKKAKDLLRGIKKIMTFNKNFKGVFGENLFSKTDNDKYELSLLGRNTTAKEVNITCYGVEMDIQSGRADLLVWEDVIGKTFIRSQANREMVFEAWEHSDPILEENSKTIVTGTRYTPDDLYSKIILENEEIHNWNITCYGVYDNTFENTGVLCSYVMDKEEVEKKKKKYSAVFFSAQYLNNPINSETNIFNIDMYSRYSEILNIEYILIAVDFSDGIGKDKNAFVIVGKGLDNKYYVLEAYGNNRIDSENFYYVIRNHHSQYSEKCLYALVELNRNGRTILRDTFDRLKKKNNDTINFVGISNMESKNIRIEKLEPLLRSGDLVLPSDRLIKEESGLSLLIDELKNFNYTVKDNQDDLLDALSMCIVAMQRREIIKERKQEKLTITAY